ncbi:MULTISPECIES: RHS repeat-associated core domain-containing protein [Pseudomonas]|uniref:RHS repeat-associated core domain-containing protein n=1 Tax=Pseudomonas TaxID=286 RepID=UPI00137A079C|nr:RHS repeat-associated core domain-containing protein [Pseudomonas juntendi]MBH3387410.1 RHS repeat-associated core domain-containing protein [Pseudomonas juntendi]MBR7521717.1 RHS repeat-associated core domain-containing protein [Pseudomonas juntendi]
MDYTPHGYSSSRLIECFALGYAGERIDRISGCYPLGAGRRSYSPVLMRFTSSDALSPFGDGGGNGYAYCSGDPVNYNDPTGKTRVPSRIMAGRGRSLKLTWNETKFKLDQSSPGELLELVKRSPDYALQIEAAEAANVLNHIEALRRNPRAETPLGLFAFSRKVFEDARSLFVSMPSRIQSHLQAPSPEQRQRLEWQLYKWRNMIQFESERAHIRINSVARKLLAPIQEDIRSWRGQ